jgi:hypothetical protein
VGWCTKGGGPEASRPTFDAARHATEDQTSTPVAGHDPSGTRTSIAEVRAGVRSAPKCHRAGVVRSIPRDPLFDLDRDPGRVPRPREELARAKLALPHAIQQDHGHFIVEGDEARRARGGMHGLAIRLALAVNRVLGRKGKVVGDRYHVRPLTTPRQMRASMVYVLLNFRKHLRAPAGVDPRSSGPHFSGWYRAPRRPELGTRQGLSSWGM